MHAISEAVDCNIPFSGGTSVIRHSVPGWSIYVKPYKDDASFWYNVWLSAGKPENCVLHNVMKRTRNKYHYALRKIRKHESTLRKDNFVADLQSGKVNNIFENIKKSRKSTASRTNMVDGTTGCQNIADKFKDLYNNYYPRMDSLSYIGR